MKITTHKIINADSAELSSVPDASVNLIVTSPPYPMIGMWDFLFCSEDPSITCDLNEGRGITAFTKMHEILNRVWKECDRVLKDNGFVCINIGDATRTLKGNFQMYPNHAYIINFFQARGYSVLPDIHWRKPSNSPNKFMGSGMYPAGAYVTYEHEYILVFRKGESEYFLVLLENYVKKVHTSGKNVMYGFLTCGKSREPIRLLRHQESPATEMLLILLKFHSV